MATRRIAVLAFPAVQALDVFGPVEVFHAADRLAGGGQYSVEVLATSAGALQTSSGVRIAPHRSLSAVRGSLDTLIVAGGDGARAAVADRTLVAFVERAAARARRVCSVCTGAFVLAEAGVLSGRQATTHWASCSALAERHPDVQVQADPIFVRDGNVATSAGVTAGMDLALALVEEDLGPDLAREVGRWLVLFLKRPGGQSQFSAPLSGPAAGRPALRELQDWIPGHLAEDLSVQALAGRALMSPRNFARAFVRELGTTPAAYVERVRVERVRSLLQSGELPPRRSPRECGFANVETLRRAFQRRVGIESRRLPPALRTPRAHDPPAPSPDKDDIMEIAIPLFDRFTALDAVGPYEVLRSMPGAKVTSPPPSAVVRTENGMVGLHADALLRRDPSRTTSSCPAAGAPAPR